MSNVECHRASVLDLMLRERTNSTLVEIRHGRPSNTILIKDDQGIWFEIKVTELTQMKGQ